MTAETGAHWDDGWTPPTWEYTTDEDGTVIGTSSDGQTEYIYTDGSYWWFDEDWNSSWHDVWEDGTESGGWTNEWGGGLYEHGVDEDGTFWHESSWYDNDGNGGWTNRDGSMVEYTAAGWWGDMDADGNWTITDDSGHEIGSGSNWEGFWELIYEEK